MNVEAELMLLIVWAVVGLVVVWFGIMTYILKYHWDKYSLSEERMRIARRRYLQAAGVCAVGLLGFLILYSISAL